MSDVPEIECGVFLGIEDRGDSLAIVFERVVIVIGKGAAQALGYVLAE